MKLIDRINNAIQSAFGEKSSAKKTTTKSAPSSPMEMTTRFSADSERRRIVETCRAMYKADPRIKKMTRTLARDMKRGGFFVDTKHEEALHIANALIKRLKLEMKLDDYARLASRDGDLFLEVGVNESLEIAEVTRKPTLGVRRNSNKADRFDDPTKAYWWADRMHFEPPKDAVWFADWQMIHARWEHDEGERYGTPMMASATSAFKRVKEGEVDVSVRRKTRSGMRYLHVLEGASPGELEAYKEKNKPALNNPFAAVADFFSNKKGSLEVVQGDALLDQIGDVKHHIETMFTAGEVPMELIAYGSDLNRDVLNKKKEEYDDSLNELQTWFSVQVIIPLIELQWLLKGILPASVDYSIVWRGKQVLTPAEVREIADTAMRLRIMGLPKAFVDLYLAKSLPGVTVEMLQNDDGDDTDDVERMAAIMQKMRGGMA